MTILWENFTLHVPPYSHSRSLEPTRIDRLYIYDFLLLVHSNYGHILYSLRDKGRYLQHFLPFVFNDSADGVPLGIL